MSDGPSVGIAFSSSVTMSHFSQPHGLQIAASYVRLPDSATPDRRMHSSMSKVHHPAGSNGGLDVLPHSGYLAETLLNAIRPRVEAGQL